MNKVKTNSNHFPYNYPENKKFTNYNLHYLMNKPNLSYPNINNNNYIKRKSNTEELFLEKKSNLLNKIKLLNKNKIKLENKLQTLSTNEENEEEDDDDKKKTIKNKLKDKELIVLENKKKYKQKLNNNLKANMMRASDFHLPKKNNVDEFTSYLDFLGKRSRPANISKFNYFTAMKFKED